ncbi:MAG: peptide/nickel transport system substrate-binding protein [Actinomycetota bacterium]|nr:peptide/nickel transport system substrate-binding protein [Actinomycetota bacterium]
MSRSTSRLSVVVTLCMVGLTTSACGGSVTDTATTKSEGTPVRGGTLNMLGVGDVDYMDPNITYFTTGALANRMWVRQLFTNPAVTGKVTTTVPDLAAEIPTTSNGGVSTDAKTYTIKLRQGPKWNTTPARAVTAGDAVRGVMRTCNPIQPFGGIPNFNELIVGYSTFCAGFAKVAHTPAAIAAYMNTTALPGVVAKDDSTVVFTLTHPAAYFPDMLTLNAFSPVPVEFNKYLPASPELAANTVANGPYRIDSYVATKSIKLSRNPAWDPASDPVRKAYVDRIVVNETSTQDSAQQQLQTSSPAADMEFDTFPPPSQIPALIAKGDKNLNIGASSSSNPYVVFNTVSPNNNKAMANVKVRQALSHAINRNNVIQVLGGPKINPPLTHVLPSTLLGGETSFDLYPYDVNKAKQMLSEAGFPNGFTVKFLYRNVSEGNRKAFQTIQQDLSKAGIKVVGIGTPQADFFTKYMQVPSVAKRGVWDVSLAGWGADWYGNGALSYFNPLFSGPPSFPPTGSNFGLYSSPAANKAINAAINAPTDERAKDLWAAADRAVMGEAPIFPITNKQDVTYKASHVHNAIYLPALQQRDPTNVWIDKAKQGG